LYSIVVPTFNRARSVRRSVESLFAQVGGAPREILVIDSGSTDDTEQHIHALARTAPTPLRYVRAGEQGASAARNAGLAASRGEIVAFIDDDEIADAGWLAALAETYRDHPDAWCVGGKIVLALPEAVPSWFSRSSRYLTGCLGGLDLGDGTLRREYPDDVWGGNFSVRREAFDRIGGFDTDLGPRGARHLSCEETDLCWRIQAAGGAVYYCGRAVVTHVVPEVRLTRRAFREQEYWHGRSKWLLDRKSGRRGPRVPREASGGIAPPGRPRPAAGAPTGSFEGELRYWRALGYAAASAADAAVRRSSWTDATDTRSTAQRPCTTRSTGRCS
jgi:glycosyltransferase involved in cell wall biosynthesis